MTKPFGNAEILEAIRAVLARLERKLVVLALFLVSTVVAGAILFLLYREGTLDDPVELVVAVGGGFVTMIAYLGLVAHQIGRSLVGTTQEIQLGTEIIATVNPDHRLRVATGDERAALADEINRMADRVQQARSGAEAEVARATHELAVVRNKPSDRRARGRRPRAGDQP